MANNTFGQIFKITTWGESHGKAIGVVIDGCPAGLAISEQEINAALALRAPGQSQLTSPRKEPDIAEIYSGVFEGETTGCPISIIIPNQDADSSKYETIKNQLRPGHANYTYLQKYGIFDYRGGGRASARETACRVAASAIAKKLLAHYNIQVCAYLQQIAKIKTPEINLPLAQLQQQIADSSLFCPDETTEHEIINAIEHAKKTGNSLGGIIKCVSSNLPVGLGDPVYEKLEANLAKAMLSIPASKGFEIGQGFNAAIMTGKTHNDEFIIENEVTTLSSNYAGGTLGGISNGMPLECNVVFKPTSSIQQSQKSVTLDGKQTEFTLPEGSRHDPCVAIRAVPVVEAMAALVLADAILMNKLSKLC